MKIRINVLSSDIEKAKLFAKYIMDSEYEQPIKIRETKCDLMIESESIICEVVKFSESFRGNRFHKLYIDSSSEIDEEIYQFVYRHKSVPYCLPNSFFRMEIANPIERINFSEFI